MDHILNPIAVRFIRSILDALQLDNIAIEAKMAEVEATGCRIIAHEMCGVRYRHHRGKASVYHFTDWNTGKLLSTVRVDYDSCVTIPDYPILFRKAVQDEVERRNEPWMLFTDLMRSVPKTMPLHIPGMSGTAETILLNWVISPSTDPGHVAMFSGIPQDEVTKILRDTNNYRHTEGTYLPPDLWQRDYWYSEEEMQQWRNRQADRMADLDDEEEDDGTE
jgi:hypothetical protein